MTTLDYSNMNNDFFDNEYDRYAHDPAFFSPSSFNPDQPSPQFSPSMDCTDLNKMFQSFTNAHESSYPTDTFGYAPNQYADQGFASSDDYSSSSLYPSQQGSPVSAFGSQPSSELQPNNMQFVNGLNIHPGHFGGMYSQAGEPSSTVYNLEEAAATAAPSAYVHQHPQPQPDRQEATGYSLRPSRSLTLDGARQFSELSLSSPRNSLSASSSASSAQNSPTTPLSTSSYDSSGYSLQQQQQHAYNSAALQHFEMNKMQQQPQHVQANSLYASVPASFAYQQPMQNFYQSQASPQMANLAPNTATTQRPLSQSVSSSSSSSLSRSRSRTTSSGLMDQIISSQESSLSPAESAGRSGSSDISDRPSSGEDKKSNSSSSKRRTRSSATPPNTPGRSSLRASRNGGPPLSVSTNVGTPPKNSSGQTPSSAGPHRTPSRRPSHIPGGLDTIFGGSTPSPAPASGGTPRRPDIRRTMSHTPRSSGMSASANSGVQEHPRELGSPAAMARTPSSLNMLSMSLGPSQRARVTAEGHLDLGASLSPSGASSSGLSRSMSSPGIALNANLGIPRPMSTNATEAFAASMSNNSRSRRSSTLSNLQMSPLSTAANGIPFSRSSTLTPSPVPAVSLSEAISHVDSLLTFCDHHASQLGSSTNTNKAGAQAHLALGTQEQVDFLKDIRRRIIARGSGELGFSS